MEQGESREIRDEPPPGRAAGKIGVAYHVAKTPGGTIYLDTNKEPMIIEQVGDGLRPWNPPTTPIVATPRAGSPGPSSSASRRPGRPRRPRVRGAIPMYDPNIEVRYDQRDSGSEMDGSGEDDDDDDEDYGVEDSQDLDDGASIMRLRAAARALQELIDESGAVAADIAGLELEPEAVVDGRAQPPDYEGDYSFDWSTDFNTFSGEKENYQRDPGPVFDGQNPLDIFLHIWDEEKMTEIVHQTNYYALQVISALAEHDNISENLETWKEVTVNEMYRYFAVLMFMGMVGRGRIKDFWTTGILEMPGFRNIMSRNRFQIISRFLHFVDNETIRHDISSYEKKVAKILPLLNFCNEKFTLMYQPEQALSLDESLLLWKGRLSWVQCIRSKAARFGIKTYELCEASSGYLLKAIIYAGKNSTMHEEPIHGFSAPTAKVVLKLMDGFLDVGHVLFMDNWYNQLPLTRYLKQRHTDIVGTLNRRRQHVPDMIKNVTEREMRVGDVVSCHCGDMALTTWKDVKLVTVISTCHKHEMAASSRAGVNRDKPIAVVEYNKYMGGVDLKDQKLSAYLLERKRGLKWYIKVFRRLLNTSLLNAYIIYTKHPVTGKLLTHREFRMKIAEDLCKRFQVTRQDIALHRPVSEETRLNLSLLHCPDYTAMGRNNKRTQRRCARCSAVGVRTMVTILCKACDVALCLGKCWLEYHTQTSLAERLG